MYSTADNVSWKFSDSDVMSRNDVKPFLQKDVAIIDDNQNGNYNRNQIVFETGNIAGSGFWADYKEAYISVPVVVEYNTTGANLTLAQAKNAVRFKGSFLNIVDTFTVDYNNTNVVQRAENINAYLQFKQHTEFSQNDLVVHDITGYKKMTSDSWDYSANMGIHNNSVVLNEGLDQEPVSYSASQVNVLTALNVKDSGVDVIEQGASAKTWYYHYDCIIRLKDLSELFNGMPLTRGGNIRITLNLNQFSLSSVINAQGVHTVTPMLQGSTVPVMRCGTPGVSTTETLSLKVVSNNGVSHVKNKCRLYVPTYTINEKLEGGYSADSKTINYTEIFTHRFETLPSGSGGSTVGGRIDNVITPNQDKMEKLIIIPMLKRNENGTLGLTPMESPYACEPCVCSPYKINNFQVLMAKKPLFLNVPEYKYESFLREMNGLGLNSGQTDGLSSGLISYKDYVETYGYICVDISRREDFLDKMPVSLEIKGSVVSPKALDFVCFVVTRKNISIRMVDGVMSQD